MVNTLKVIVQKQGEVLRKKAEKAIQRSHKRVHIKYSHTKSVSAFTTEWSVQRQLFGLSLSVNPEASMSAKKKSKLPYGCVLCSIVKH